VRVVCVWCACVVCTCPARIRRNPCYSLAMRPSLSGLRCSGKPFSQMLSPLPSLQCPVVDPAHPALHSLFPPPAAQIGEALGLAAIKDRQWSIQETSAAAGKGLHEGFDWLVNAINTAGK